ncbi:CocE/NonD family hydrolase [Acidobacteriota bacterium]
MSKRILHLQNSIFSGFFWKAGIFVFLFILIISVSCQKETVPIEYSRLQSLHVPMRDGVKIAIDVWLPENLEPNSKIPALMYCTRYWRAIDIIGATLEMDQNYERANDVNSAGYAFVLVDARGTGASYGTRAYEYNVEEVKDYGEIADWIVEQRWSNGKVGAFGVSYSGTTAELLMVNQRSAVKAVAPLYDDFNAFDFLLDPGGVLLNYMTENWGRMVSAMDHNDICALQGVTGEQCEELKKKVRGVKPVDEDLDRSLLAEAVEQHKNNTKLHEVVFEFRDDPYGPQQIANVYETGNPSGFLKEIEDSGTAIYIRVGWLDAATVNGALSRFLSVDSLQKVYIGPWSHGGGRHADPFLPPETPTDPPVDQQWADMVAFFDLFLKDQEPPPMESSITYFTQGAGVWHETKVWPPEGFSDKTWYFGSKGTLSNSEPDANKGSDGYTIDFEATTGTSNRWYTQLGGGDVIYPDRAEKDKELLTYTSQPMAADMEITGHPLVTLYISSSAQDGAFFVYLEDVDEDGRVTYITEGHLRAMCRKVSEEEPPFKFFGPYRTFKRADSAPLVPGEVVELTFDLIATSTLIKKGHRIRIAIAGADKDSFDRFPRDGSIPTIHVERNSQYPSRIVLPIKTNQ